MARFDSNARFDTGITYDSGPPAPPPVHLKPKSKLMSKFKLELKGKKVGDKLTLGTQHINSMTGNTYYPAATRVPADAAVQTAQDELAAAAADVDTAEVVWKQKIQIRDVKEATWDEVTTARARFYEAATPNNLEALASTGLPLRPPPTPIGDLPAPANLRAFAREDPGQIDLTCDTVKGAGSYEWECRQHEAPTGPWTAIKITTSASHRVLDLTSGTLYAFRVRAIGAAGPGTWSDEAVKRAQ